MPGTSVARQASALSMQGHWYSADLLPQIQIIRAALTDIDVRYHSDQEQLQGWAGPKVIKTRFTAQLAERYRGSASLCSAARRVTASDGSDGVPSLDDQPHSNCCSGIDAAEHCDRRSGEKATPR